jgi:penicillin G amidase
MPKWIKLSIGIISTILILVAVAGIIFYKMLNDSLPIYEGEIRSNLISANVEIYRDSVAIPYIIAQSENDAAFALGFVHAQDRLFQMDMMRRAGEGRLSEILGTKTIPFDKMFLTIGIKNTVNNNFKKLDKKSIDFLQTYADGVNHFITSAAGKYPVEFDVLGYDPYPWTPEHSLIIGRMMAWELNISWWIDFSFAQLVQKFGEEKIKEIIPNFPENNSYIIPPELKTLPAIPSAFRDTDRAFRNFMGLKGTHIGSNNWVVNGILSQSGKPIIANDAHLAYSAPGKWYSVVIKSDEWNSAGFTLPGIPMIIIGKNENISWTVTNIMMDDADFYTEKLDSSKKNYQLNGDWQKLTTYKEIVKVKDSLDVVLEIRSTHRGPIISDIHPFTVLYPESDADDVPISMRWLGNDYSDEFTSYFKINRSKNWEEFKSSFSDYSVPGQNFVYADREGNIGYMFGGKLPIRESVSPTFVYDGSTDNYDWKGIMPFEQQPFLFNPPANFIASANNKTIQEFKYHISNLWEPSSRYDRIVELISSKPKHSAEDYKKYQFDFVSPYAEIVSQHILSAFENIKVTDENLNTALTLIDKWNYEFDEFSQAPTIYAMFFKYLLENIYLDEMGKDQFNEFVFVANIPYRSVLQLLNNPSSSWFDNVNTNEIETKEEIIRKSLVDALNELEKKFGKNAADWQWGKLHQVKFKHAFSGVSSFIDNFINIGPYPIGGDGTTINNTEYAFNEGIEEFPLFDHEPFENDLGPSMRFIYDLSKPEEFFMILTTGQSGNIMSDHYKDMTKLWLYGEYVKVKTDEASIKNPANKLLKIIKE